jgi:hypothetical protein
MSPAGWDMAIYMCRRTIYVYERERKICFGENDCIKYGTKRQFDMAFETLMKTIECCKEHEYKVIDEVKKVCGEGRV